MARFSVAESRCSLAFSATARFKNSDAQVVTFLAHAERLTVPILEDECPQQDGQTGLARVPFPPSRLAEVSAGSLESWSRVAGGGFELRLFQGGHFFMHGRHDQVVEVVRATACECLGRAS